MSKLMLPLGSYTFLKPHLKAKILGMKYEHEREKKTFLNIQKKA